MPARSQMTAPMTRLALSLSAAAIGALATMAIPLKMRNTPVQVVTLQNGEAIYIADPAHSEALTAQTVPTPGLIGVLCIAGVLVIMLNRHSLPAALDASESAAALGRRARKPSFKTRGSRPCARVRRKYRAAEARL